MLTELGEVTAAEAQQGLAIRMRKEENVRIIHDVDERTVRIPRIWCKTLQDHRTVLSALQLRIRKKRDCKSGEGARQLSLFCRKAAAPRVPEVHV